jgi:hypothetical protein
VTEDAVPLDAAVWATMLTRPGVAAMLIGLPIGLVFGAIVGVAVPAVFGVRLYPFTLPLWADVAAGAPAGVIAVYLELTKPY